jgi:hypothetical protein
MATVTVQDDGKNNRQSFEARIELEAGEIVTIRGYGATETEALKNAEENVREFQLWIHEEAVDGVSKVKSRIANLA